ncbi:MAG: efflux RND transporter permease subunit, partial [Gammaproteobacteria bacterium]|nr:efflux RND transporter permease subunit [Gammaproteobacteria bacterium]
KIISKIPGTASVYSERVVGGRYIKVDINRDKSARYGLNISDVQQVVATAIGGMNVTWTVEGSERYPVNLRYPQDYRDSPEQLSKLPIVTPVGERIALGDVARIYIEDGPPGIKSENARINGWVYVDLDKGTDTGSYVEVARQTVSHQLELPAGYSIKWSGQYEYMERVEEKLGYIIPVTVTLILLLLYLNFRNVIEVVIIMGTLPFALVGGVTLMYLMDYNFSVAAGVGLIALAGVAVEIGVIMLVYLNQSFAHAGSLSQRYSDEALRQMILEGAGKRVRPVVMTTLASITGLLPVMIGSGTGSEIMSRIAAPMVGGMVSTLILGLLVLPVVYYLWKRRSQGA